MMAKTKSTPKVVVKKADPATAPGFGFGIGFGAGNGPNTTPMIGISPGLCNLAACITILLIICCCFGWFCGPGFLNPL